MKSSRVSESTRVQEPFLNELRKARRQVEVYLRSGVRLQGLLASFDAHMILLSGARQHTVFKHEIASIARLPFSKRRARHEPAPAQLPERPPEDAGPIRRRVEVSRKPSAESPRWAAQTAEPAHRAGLEASTPPPQPVRTPGERPVLKLKRATSAAASEGPADAPAQHAEAD